MNPIKDVQLEAAGKSYTFVFGSYAVALVERASGQTWTKFIRRKSDEWGGSEMLQMFHAGLHRHHKMTEEEAADLMDELGAEEVARVVQEALGIAEEGPRPTEKADRSGKKT